MPLGIDPTIDYAFKLLFGSEAAKPRLLDFLRAVLGDWLDVPILELRLLNPFNEKGTPDDKLSILDIKAEDQAGRLYNLEMQRQVISVYADRALYYWSRIHSQELREGEGYETLRPNAGIHVLSEPLFPETADYHLSFSLRCDQHHELRLTRDLTIHTIELSKFGLKPEELQESLEKWCYFLRHAEELEPAALPEPLRTPEIEEAVEALRVMALNTVQYGYYEARLKESRDLEAKLKDARSEGRKEGMTEGEWTTIEAILDLKFGEDGLKLMKPVRTIHDLTKLRELRQAVKTAMTVDEVWTRLH